MSSESWMTSLSCSNTLVTENPSSSPLVLWVKFMFLYPCPQRALLSAIDVVFLLVLFGVFVRQFFSKAIFRNNPESSLRKPTVSNPAQVQTNVWYRASLIVTALLGMIHLVSAVLAVSRKNMESPWRIVNESFGIIQVLTYFAIVILIVHEKRFEAAKHPLSLRVFWVVSFLIYALIGVSGLIRLIRVSENHLRLEDIISLISFALSTFLLVVGVRGSTGIEAPMQESSVLEPLLEKANVSGFADASLVSKTFWIWISPLLSKGYKTPLTAKDVPTLSPQHRAERMSDLFESNWPKPTENCKNPVLKTLLRCFWKELSFTAFLAVVRICVMYVGPLLLQSFVDFTSGKRSSPYEGYYLVLILLVAKFVEVLCTHQFNFQSQKLGMLIRGSLITNLYKKGLKLTCSARQAHGVGPIVNYMAVDTQQLSDMMLQLHAIWLTPFQILVALALLYNYLGRAMVTSLLGILGVMLFIIFGTKRNNRFQFNLMQNPQ